MMILVINNLTLKCVISVHGCYFINSHSSGSTFLEQPNSFKDDVSSMSKIEEYY